LWRKNCRRRPRLGPRRRERGGWIAYDYPPGVRVLAGGRRCCLVHHVAWAAHMGDSEESIRRVPRAARTRRTGSSALLLLSV